MAEIESKKIVIGTVQLVRQAQRYNEATTAVVSDIIFKDCPTSKQCWVVLGRAVRELPPYLKKLKGWKIAELTPQTHLGYSLEKENAEAAE